MESLEKVWKIRDLQDVGRVASEIWPLVSNSQVLYFNGEMGAGKTTFIAALAKLAGSKDAVSSPTYSIVNPYLCDNGYIYHFDLYRLKNTEELMAIGFFDYLDQPGSRLWIEWPDLAVPLLQNENLPSWHLFLRAENNGRIISLKS